MHVHAERGHDQSHTDRFLTLRVGMPLRTLRVPAYTRETCVSCRLQPSYRSFLTLRMGMPLRTLRVPAYTPVRSA